MLWAHENLCQLKECIRKHCENGAAVTAVHFPHCIYLFVCSLEYDAETSCLSYAVIFKCFYNLFGILFTVYR